MDMVNAFLAKMLISLQANETGAPNTSVQNEATIIQASEFIEPVSKVRKVKNCRYAPGAL